MATRADEAATGGPSEETAADTVGRGSAQWPPRRPSKRSKMRNGTFIIPSTGERSRRQFTLRNGAPATEPATLGDDYDADEDPSSFFTAAGFSTRMEGIGRWAGETTVRFRAWADSPKGRGVIKCTVAYMIASLWTFWPPLSNLLGKPDGKHLVATITVYFHPARSAGSMIEAGAISILAVAYAELVSILSMASSVLFGSVLGLVRLAYAVVLIFFIGVAFGFVGWVKQRMNNPSVNVGCTLASLAIITVVTKENATYSSVFSNTKIVQVLKILGFGICTTSAVSLLLWRVSARALLRASLARGSTALGDMLAMITHGFLSGAEDELVVSDSAFRAASGAWTTAHAAMTANLREAKYEHYALGRADLYALEKAVYRSMETLAQSMGGLRSAADTQFGLLRAAADEEEAAEAGGNRPALSQLGSLAAISEASEESEASAENRESRESQESEAAAAPPRPLLPLDAAAPTLRTPTEIFELFIDTLGPSLKSLAFTLAGVLRDPPFGAAPELPITVNAHYRQSLADALQLFHGARRQALQQVYRTIELGRPRSEKIKADFEEVAAACGHFSFSLQAFGEEMLQYLDAVDTLRLASLRRRRSWRWLLFWRAAPRRADDADDEPAALLPSAPSTPTPIVRPIRKSQLPRGIPDTMVRRRDTFQWQAAPQANAAVRWLAEAALRFGRVLMRDDIRFGIKVGVGAMLWACMAFTPQTRAIYTHWRGEWGLLSFMIVCSNTVGASNTTAVARFLATLTGASVAVINWDVSQGHAVPLLLLGGLVAFGGFYLMVDRGRTPVGRTTLLAYNVVTLYAYLLSQRVDDNDDDEGGVHPLIFEIATHRFLAVTAGILWGLLVCRVVWPNSARHRFQEGLSVLYLQMGLIWKRGPLAMLLQGVEGRDQDDRDRDGPGGDHYLRAGEQAALQRYAARLGTLRQSAASEFELRGPFPFVATGRVLAATGRILDGFSAMSLLTQRRASGRLTAGERALLRYTAPERAILCDRICHVFQVLASSFMLEYPLADALPSVGPVRDRLLARIFQFRKEHATPVEDLLGGEPRRAAAAVSTGAASPTSTDTIVPDEKDYALLYAYALITGQVADELKTIAKEFEGLFGVLDDGAMLLQ